MAVAVVVTVVVAVEVEVRTAVEVVVTVAVVVVVAAGALAAGALAALVAPLEPLFVGMHMQPLLTLLVLSRVLSWGSRERAGLRQGLAEELEAQELQGGGVLAGAHAGLEALGNTLSSLVVSICHAGEVRRIWEGRGRLAWTIQTLASHDRLARLPCEGNASAV